MGLDSPRIDACPQLLVCPPPILMTSLRLWSAALSNRVSACKVSDSCCTLCTVYTVYPINMEDFIFLNDDDDDDDDYDYDYDDDQIMMIIIIIVIIKLIIIIILLLIMF